MKVILIKPVENIGKEHEIVEVSDGFARNYLFPKKLAIPASVGNIRGFQKAKDRFSKKIEKIRSGHMDLAQRINNLTIKTTIKTGIDGKSFGSITSNDLVELLNAEGVKIDKKNIILEESIKHPGVYDIKVHFSEKINAAFKLILIEEGA